MRAVIKKLLNRESLSINESYEACVQILTNATDAQIGAFLSLLAAKGETADEILGILKAIKEQAYLVNIDYDVIDIVGTGGDYSNSLNISTASALLVATCGVPVVKNGNRSVSSLCGSADVLEALGYSINTKADKLVDELQQNNFVFCFAPNFHPILAKVRNVRKEIGIASVFNLLGPLLNPAKPQHILLGVNSPEKMELIAEVLFKTSTKKSMVVCGNGLDEISCLGVSKGILVTPEGLVNLTITPEEYGLKRCTLNDLLGKDAKYNAEIIKRTLSGEMTPLTDTIVLNVGVALFLYGRVNKIMDGVNVAKKRLLQGGIIESTNNHTNIATIECVQSFLIKQNKLQQIISRKQAGFDKHKRKEKSFKLALSKPNAVICEIKRASPSVGAITEIKDPIGRANEYILAGASAISVLTDEGFNGSIEDLKLVAKSLANTDVPVLCKDFIFTPEQIADAKNAGANAILLMVSVLKDKTADMVKLAHVFGLETLVEIHDVSELAIALNSGSDVIGVNQRDLTDFTMHPEIFSNTINKLPKTIIKVAESGIKSFSDAQKLYAMGYDAVLVGEALSRLDNPKDFFTVKGK